MRIGVLGAGQLAQAFARRATAAGHEVILSNRAGPQSLSATVSKLGPSVFAGTALAAAEMDTVVLAVQSDHVDQALIDLPDWGGRTLVDATNDLLGVAPLPGLLTSSERVAELARGARVVKALNTISACRFAGDPRRAEGRRVVLVSGDDIPSKRAFQGLVEQMGFAAIDLGGLAEGGRLQQVPGGILAGVDLMRFDR